MLDYRWKKKKEEHQCPARHGEETADDYGDSLDAFDQALERRKKKGYNLERADGPLPEYLRMMSKVDMKEAKELAERMECPCDRLRGRRI